MLLDTYALCVIARAKAIRYKLLSVAQISRSVTGCRSKPAEPVRLTFSTRTQRIESPKGCDIVGPRSLIASAALAKI